MKAMKEILICMGSSCFARGNTENLEFIESFLKEHNLEAKVILSGSRCLGECSQGPSVMIDGIIYYHITREKLKDIFEV